MVTNDKDDKGKLKRPDKEPGLRKLKTPYPPNQRAREEEARENTGNKRGLPVDKEAPAPTLELPQSFLAKRRKGKISSGSKMTGASGTAEPMDIDQEGTPAHQSFVNPKKRHSSDNSGTRKSPKIDEAASPPVSPGSKKR